MFQRSSLSVVAVLAVGGALIAGCSSSSSSSSSAPASAAAAASTAASSPAASAAATGVSAADCTIINGISAGVIQVLTPLQSESTSKAAVTLKAYISTLTADEAKLTSPAGKAAVASFISALQKSLTETPAQATGPLTTAIGNLASACA